MKNRSTKSSLSFILSILVACGLFGDVLIRQAMAEDIVLPLPGMMLACTDQYYPVELKGIKIDRKNPFNFDFIVDTGDSGLDRNNLKEDAQRLIDYFMASLTVPLEDIWVNLSPYEQDRVIPENLSTTEMGRDLLAQDYILKQLSSSLTHPDTELGKEYWTKLSTFNLQLSTAESPAFSKIWIVPDKAEVHYNDGTAFVARSKLTIECPDDSGLRILLPQLEEELNTGRNFATLRQIYSSMILAYWYKKNIQTILTKEYSDKSRIKGIDCVDKRVKEQIFAAYKQAFEKGAYNCIRKINRQKREYFSGGFESERLASEYRDFQMPPKDLLSSALSAGKGQYYTLSAVFENAGTERKPVSISSSVEYKSGSSAQVRIITDDQFREQFERDHVFIDSSDFIKDGERIPISELFRRYSEANPDKLAGPDDVLIFADAESLFAGKKVIKDLIFGPDKALDFMTGPGRRIWIMYQYPEAGNGALSDLPTDIFSFKNGKLSIDKNDLSSELAVVADGIEKFNTAFPEELKQYLLTVLSDEGQELTEFLLSILCFFYQNNLHIKDNDIDPLFDILLSVCMERIPERVLSMAIHTLFKVSIYDRSRFSVYESFKAAQSKELKKALVMRSILPSQQLQVREFYSETMIIEPEISDFIIKDILSYLMFASEDQKDCLLAYASYKMGNPPVYIRALDAACLCMDGRLAVLDYIRNSGNRNVSEKMFGYYTERKAVRTRGASDNADKEKLNSAYIETLIEIMVVYGVSFSEQEFIIQTDMLNLIKRNPYLHRNRVETFVLAELEREDIENIEFYLRVLDVYGSFDAENIVLSKYLDPSYSGFGPALEYMSSQGGTAAFDRVWDRIEDIKEKQKLSEDTVSQIVRYVLSILRQAGHRPGLSGSQHEKIEKFANDSVFSRDSRVRYALRVALAGELNRSDAVDFGTIEKGFGSYSDKEQGEVLTALSLMAAADNRASLLFTELINMLYEEYLNTSDNVLTKFLRLKPRPGNIRTRRMIYKMIIKKGLDRFLKESDADDNTVDDNFWFGYCAYLRDFIASDPSGAIEYMESEELSRADLSGDLFDESAPKEVLDYFTVKFINFLKKADAFKAIDIFGNEQNFLNRVKRNLNTALMARTGIEEKEADRIASGEVILFNSGDPLPVLSDNEKFAVLILLKQIADIRELLSGAEPEMISVEYVRGGLLRNDPLLYGSLTEEMDAFLSVLDAAGLFVYDHHYEKAADRLLGIFVEADAKGLIINEGNLFALSDFFADRIAPNFYSLNLKGNFKERFSRMFLVYLLVLYDQQKLEFMLPAAEETGERKASASSAVDVGGLRMKALETMVGSGSLQESVTEVKNSFSITGLRAVIFNIEYTDLKVLIGI